MKHSTLLFFTAALRALSATAADGAAVPDIARLEQEAIRSEHMPLACGPVAKLGAQDLALRAAMLRAIARPSPRGRICLSVFVKGRAMQPPPALLDLAGLRDSLTGQCGCRWWEPDVHVILLPEMTLTPTGGLAIGFPRGSTSEACDYDAVRAGNGWQVTGMCRIY
jgi:hypothetical protein